MAPYPPPQEAATSTLAERVGKGPDQNPNDTITTSPNCNPNGQESPTGKKTQASPTAIPEIQWYYGKHESRIAYWLLLSGAKHFGYYPRGTFNPFPITSALRRMENEILQCLSLAPGSRVLDLGCGEGHISRYIAREGSFPLVLGLDITASHLAKARRAISGDVLRGFLRQGQVEVRLGDYHDLFTSGTGIKMGEWDGVTAVETLAHAVDTKLAFSEVYRALKPGGRFCFNDYRIGIPDDVVRNESDGEVDEKELSPQQRKTLKAWRWVMRTGGMKGSEYSYAGTYERLLKEAGFVDVKVVDLSENMRPMARWFWILSLLPYAFAKLFRLEKAFYNSVSMYEQYVEWGGWAYCQWSATKPAT
ncbi:hypothetical protein MKZ38_007718 [Zalerion maritima]|uniref:Methyltransferase domain-containing protein n=1 Tax=Zalerion maritima TaxID=339359 RepID=A0AAD5RI93_9PEZI|nr:hypothetical protein MKZ38_007718 [Zalerion maritima]